MLNIHLIGQTLSFYPKAQKLLGTFSVYHIQPITLNEKSSREIVELFIQEIDPGGFILKASDCKAFRNSGEQLLNEVLAGKDNYYERAKKIYAGALNCTDSILKSLSAKKIDLQKNDTIKYQIIPDKQINYSANTTIYAKRMAAFIKLLAFNLISNAEDFESISETDFKTRVLSASEKIIQNHIKKIQGESKNLEAYIQSCLLNAMALRFDPHSNYFTEQQNEAFNTSLSSELETFGFYLDESDDGRIFISDMDPGGPAWLSNEINNDDIFISAKIGNETFTAEDYDAAAIQEKINQSKNKKISIVIRKQNQSVKTVTLIKQVIASSENHVKGYVLNSNGITTGYISLPSFYTDMDEHNKPGCANDVAKEILKLENDSISGLIIDLRNNGGGSMEEAMNLAGIFIDEGPLFIFKEKNKKPTLMKDMNRGSIFKKPLVVMINEGSASASELFSNIIKDYNAGIVVGQKSYG
ncbi:MAG: S41 family peptidase, partial [Bacteroidota bacterium]